MKKNGFTITELLVVITVIAVLAAVAFVNFPKVKMKLSLLRAAYSFEQNLRLAQQMALSETSYMDESGNKQKIDGYGVFLNLNSLGNKKYYIYADKNPGNGQYDSSDYVVSEFDLATDYPGIKIEEINNTASSGTSINFSQTDAKTLISQLQTGQNSIEVVFSAESDSSITKSVLVNKVGLIENK